MPRVSQRSVVLLSYFTLRDLGNLLDAVRRSGIANQADVYIGSYGANPKTANAAHEEGTLYAPMLGLRTVLPKPLPSTAARRIAAGRAVGRSFRDKMGDSAETWQFDEISRLVTRSRETREFARGVLDGLHDDSLRGFVWLAHSAFGLASQPVDAELSAFWHDPQRSGVARRRGRVPAVRRRSGCCRARHGRGTTRTRRRRTGSPLAGAALPGGSHTGLSAGSRPRRQREPPVACVREQLARALSLGTA